MCPWDQTTVQTSGLPVCCAPPALPGLLLLQLLMLALLRQMLNPLGFPPIACLTAFGMAMRVTCILLAMVPLVARLRMVCGSMARSAQCWSQRHSATGRQHQGARLASLWAHGYERFS